MSTLPLRRSARIIARDAARVNRTPEEIQATLQSVKQMHTRTILDVHRRMEVDFDRFEEIVKTSSAPHVVYHVLMKKFYLEEITSLRTHYYNYHIFALNTIDALNEEAISCFIPCVDNMERLGMSLNHFVASLKCDLENKYVMRELVAPFCKRRIQEIKDLM